MTQKIVKAYHSLSKTARFSLTLSIVTMLIFGFIMVAMAASGISFSGHTPGNGTTISSAKPNIGLKISTSEGAVQPADVNMTLDGKVVTPDLTADTATGVYNLNYSPSINLTDGSHSVVINVYDASQASPKSTNWSFTVNAAPKANNLAPADGSKVDNASPKISAYIKDTYDNLDANSFSFKIDGNIASAQFKYKGYDNYDQCTGEYLGWKVTSYKEGTVEYQSSNLADGVHTAELSISDVNGNVLVKTWSFTIATKPVFSDFNPSNGAYAKSFSSLSVKVKDYNLDPSTIILKDNGAKVSHAYDVATGTISYTANFSYGEHKITVSASDTAGNTGSASWSFIVDNAAPTIYVRTLEFNQGALKFDAQLADLVDITPDTVLKLDGNALSANIYYEPKYDTCTGEIIGIETKKAAYVKYEGTISDGSHTLTLTRGDILGNAATQSWSLNVASAPVIKNWTPVTYISNFKPTITANLKDVNSTLSLSNITMTLNGTAVVPNYDSTTGNLSYTPSGNLSNESYHTVYIKAIDPGGLASEITWKFYVNTYPEMADSNMVNCSACHNYDQNATIPFENVHSKISFYGGHGTNSCEKCHYYITYPADCYQCHGTDEHPAQAPHGSTPSIEYQLKNHSPFWPIRVKENREMWDCIICHQPGSDLMAISRTGPVKNHDIPELHKAPASECNKCHAQSLTREHARDGRVDRDGKPITCNTCHKSTDTNIQNAITNNKKDCASCHGVVNHDSLHISGLDSNCQSCHSKTLTIEHLSNATTQGKNYSCETCHNSTQSPVQRTIAANNLNCTGCHSLGHNFNLADSILADIPLYPGYSWTNPIEADIFTGDPTTPSGYSSGQVIISNRKTDVTSDQAWTFYKNQLEAKGWKLTGSAPASGTPCFVAVFEKEGRHLTVKCYDTALSDGSGTSLASGRRIELWYK